MTRLSDSTLDKMLILDFKLHFTLLTFNSTLEITKYANNV